MIYSMRNASIYLIKLRTGTLGLQTVAAYPFGGQEQTLVQRIDRGEVQQAPGF